MTRVFMAQPEWFWIKGKFKILIEVIWKMEFKDGLYEYFLCLWSRLDLHRFVYNPSAVSIDSKTIRGNRIRI